MSLAASSLFGVKPTVSHINVGDTVGVVAGRVIVVVEGAATVVVVVVVIAASVVVVLSAAPRSVLPSHEATANATTPTSVTAVHIDWLLFRGSALSEDDTPMPASSPDVGLKKAGQCMPVTLGVASKA